MLATSVLVRQQLQIDRWLLELQTGSPNRDLLARVSEELTLHLHVVDVLVLFLARRQDAVPRGGASASVRAALREILADPADAHLAYRIADLRWLFGLQCNFERDHVLPRMRRSYTLDELAALGHTMDQVHTLPTAESVVETGMDPANDRVRRRTIAQA
jgi:hypothetical protein